MTGCQDTKLLMHALLDDELDAANALTCEAHLAACPNCAAEYRGYQALRSAIRSGENYRQPPDRLRSRIEGTLDAAAGSANRTVVPLDGGRPLRRSWHQWVAAGSGLALAAGLALFISAPLRTPNLAEDLISDHLRSLQANHLTDISTSDQHVVKPWFAGKLNFSPPVADLKSFGFPLVGGRLDYVSDRAAAALVYRRRDHIINVFIWPNDGAEKGSIPSGEWSREGHNILSWTEGDMNFSAVSDLNLPELHELVKQLRAATR